MRGGHSKKQINSMAENFVDRCRPTYHSLFQNNPNVSKLNNKFNRLFYLFNCPDSKKFNDEITNISRRLNLCLNSEFSDTKKFVFVKEIVNNLISNGLHNFEKQCFDELRSNTLITNQLDFTNKVTGDEALVGFIISFLSSVSKVKLENFKMFNDAKGLLTLLNSELEKKNKNTAIKLISKLEYETIFEKTTKTFKPLLPVFGKIYSNGSKRRFFKKFVKQNNTSKILFSKNSIGGGDSYSYTKNRFSLQIKKNLNKFRRKYFLKKNVKK